MVSINYRMSEPYGCSKGGLVRINQTKEYKRPNKTQTDSLTSADIKELLKDYDRVNDISTVELGAQIRYFAKVQKGPKGEIIEKFRYGGNLINKRGLPAYIVLSNGKVTWSVQVKGTKFYRKIDAEEAIEYFKRNKDKGRVSSSSAA